MDAPDLHYELRGWHVALVATGAGAAHQIRRLAASLDRRLLLVRFEEGEVWAWLGGRRRMEGAEVYGAVAAVGGEIRLALGTPAEGEAGWRLSHRQARAVFSLARRDGDGIVRYEESGLLASAMRDEVLVDSLRRSYLEPLEAGRDGQTLRRTLRAYIAAGRNVSSTAATIGVSRQTVNKRLRAAEARIGRPLDSCLAELQIALALQDRIYRRSHM